MKDPFETGERQERERKDVDAKGLTGEQKKRFAKPKLTYVKPKVERHGIPDVTAGFFGTFYA